MKGRGVGGRFVLWLCVAFVLGIVVSLIVANLGAAEKKVDRPLERVHDTRDPAFARDLSLLLGPPLVDGNAAEVLVNGDRIFKAMLEDIRSAKSTISFETYIYWDGTIGDEFADALADRAQERRQGARAARLDRQHPARQGRARADEGRRRRGRALSRAALVAPAAAQQPDAPQDPGGRRPGRLHRRRRHRRQVARRRRGCRPLARHPFPGARPGGGADAVGVQRQLDQGDRPGAARADLLPADGAGVGRHAGADVQQLAERRRREHAPDVPARHHRGEDEHRALEQLLRARRADDPRPGRGGEARREGAHRRARADHRFAASSAAPRAPTGGRCSRPACRSPSTSRRCSTARCWSSTAGSSRSARPTSTTGRSASTTRPTSTCSTRSSPPSR